MSSVMHNARIDRLDRAKSVNSRTNATPSLPPRSDLTKKSGLVECEGKEGKDRKSTRLNSSHSGESRMPSSA